MPDKRCCCGSAGCPIFEDDFDRANSTNIGSDWEEAWGDSSIVDHTLRVPSEGLVIGTKQHPSGAAELGHTGEVRATAKNLQVGNKYQLCINAWEDPVEGWVFLYGQLECLADGVAKISVSGGDSFDTLAYDPGQDAVMYLCRSEHGLYFTVPDVGEGSVWGCHEDNGGRKAGVANPGNVAVNFGPYYFGETWWTNSACPKCFCECWDGAEYHCMPKTLTLTYTASGLCSCQDGATCSLERESGSDSPVRWSGDIPNMLYWDCNDNHDTHFQLTCEEPSGKCGGAAGSPEWLLCKSLSGGDFIECGDDTEGYEQWDCEVLCDVSGHSNACGACAVEATCNPFYLKFGPFICTLTEETCIYYIEIMEP